MMVTAQSPVRIEMAEKITRVCQDLSFCLPLHSFYIYMLETLEGRSTGANTCIQIGIPILRISEARAALSVKHLRF